MEENKEQNVASAATAEVKAAPSAQGKPAAAGRNGNHDNRGRGGRRFNRNARGGRKEEQEYEEKVVKISRVAKTVKGGKRVRFTALVVIGDKKGKYGYGLGKSAEVPEAIKKALAVARKNLKKIDIAKGDTITHTVRGTFGATSVFLKPAPEGTGLVAGGAVRAILELAGIKNVYSKIYGSRTQNNVVKATIEGLSQLKTYESVSRIRYGREIKKEAPKAEEAK